MNKVVKLSVIFVLIVLMIGVLVACNNDSTPQDMSQPLPDGVLGGGGTSSDTTPTPDVDTNPGEPVYLTFSYVTQAPSVFMDIYVDEFKLENVLYHVNYVKTVDKKNVYTVGEGQPLTEDMLTAESKKLIKVAGHHSIFVNKTVDGNEIGGSFFLHLQERVTASLIELSFKLDGGVAQFGSTNGDVATAKVPQGSSYTWSELVAQFPVSKSGFALESWKKGSTVYNSSTTDAITFNENTTLTATWTNAYIGVTFDINLPEGVDTWAPATDNTLPAGAENGSWTVNAVKYNGVVTRPNVHDINTLTGYTFAGWNTKADKTGDVWNFNSKVGGENFTLYAMWEVREYSVTYYLMGGEFKGDNAIDTDKTQLDMDVVYANGYHAGDAEYDPNYTQNYLTDKPIQLSFGGLSYGANLADYYATCSATKDSKKKVTVSADPEILKGQIVKGIVDGEACYYVEGWYTSSAYREDELYTGGTLTADVELYAKWTLKEDLTSAQKEKYFTEYLYNYTKKADGTVRIDLVKDAAVNVLVIPDTIEGLPVTEIGASAGLNLMSLNVIDASQTTSLTTIGATAFASCASLREIKHPATSKITSIGKDAFVSTEWYNYYAQNNGTEFVSLGTVLIGYVGDQTVTELDLSGSEFDNLTVIAPYAFYKLSNLEKITIGDSFKEIGSCAFFQSTNLKTIEGGANLEYIAADALKETAFINSKPADDPETSDVDESTYLRIGSIFYKFLATSSSSAVIPSGIKVIAPNAFYGANSVTSIKFMDASEIVSVDSTAFTSTKWIRSEIGTESTGHAGTFIKDGFVVVNYTLVNYTGHDSILSFPAEIKKIASRAFASSNAKITNIIIPVDSALEIIETEAFYGVTTLKAISFIDTDLAFPYIENNAFSGSDGEIVNANLNFYFYKTPYDRIMTSTSAAGDEDSIQSWKTFAAGNADRIKRLATESARFSSEIPVKYLSDGNAIDFSTAWAAQGLLTADGLNFVDGAIVRRTDGVERTENLPVASIIFASDAGDKGVHALSFTIGGGVDASGADYDVVSATLNYEVFMAIDDSTIKFYHTDDNGVEQIGVPTFYTTQNSLPKKGLGVSFKYVDGTDGKLALDDEQIECSGYAPQRGDKKPLTVKINYQGLAEYSKIFEYRVDEPKNKSIKPITAFSLSVNSDATSKYKEAKFLVVMDDGKEKVVTLQDVTVISRTDAENKYGSKKIDIDTTELGYHTAGVVYGTADKGLVYSTFIYSVTLDTDANTFTYKITSAANHEAVIVGISSAHQATVAVPSKVKLNDQGKYNASATKDVEEYTIVGIANNAFKNDKKVEYVYIPYSVTWIGEDAFSGCTALKQVRSFDNKGDLKTASIGIDSLRITEETVYYVGDVTITGVVKASLDVYIPVAFTETIYRDGEGTDGCDLVEEWTRKVYLAPDALSAVTGKIYLPDNEYFREYAKAYLSTDEELNANVKFYKESDSVTTSVEKFTFSNYENPDNLTANATGKATIISNANVSVIDGLIIIPAYVDADTADMKKTYSITAFDEGAFATATDYDAVCFPNTIESYNGNLGNLYGTGKSYYDVITYVYKVSDDYIYAPANHFSAAVKSIGDRAFYGCTSLGLVTETEDNTIDFSASVALEEIGMNAFYGCTAIASLDLSKTKLTEVDDGAFAGCTALVGVVLPETVKVIGNGAFEGCSELTAVSGMKNVIYIGNRAFADCSKLTTAYIPENVTLASVEVSEDEYSGLGTDAFANTSALETVYVLSKDVAENIKMIGENNSENAGGITSDRDVVYVISSATVTDTGFLGIYEVDGEATEITVDGATYEVVKYVKKA